MSYKKILVVPSIRENHFQQFLRAWSGLGYWDAVFLVEDNPKASFVWQMGPNDRHFSWQEIEEITSPRHWIFSRRDSAIRCFGFLAAYWSGADYVLTLDDDCFPDSDGYIFSDHINAMEGSTKWSPTCGFATRGVPYRNLGRFRTVANVGLWSGVGDYDAVQTLSMGKTGEFIPPAGSRIVPRGQYTNVCGMNLCIARAAIPLFYMPLMGDGQPFSRFDDIWSGIIAKRCLDHLGWSMSIGGPTVCHKRASNVFDNLVKEAPGVRLNEVFWQIIDQAPIGGSTAEECIQTLGVSLSEGKLVGDISISEDDSKYLKKMGSAMYTWGKLFMAKPAVF